jgi:hypothetical protein
MTEFPEQPFLTVGFSQTGGGLDFLGMRRVNLAILTEHLLPGINNATRDLGSYCIATWIAWKFKQLCSRSSDFVLSRYRSFQERVEVAMSHTMRPESPSTSKFGKANQRIGLRQRVSFPSSLSFKNAKRQLSNSLFAAPFYGPSLRYLGLIQGEAIAQDGSSTGIPLPFEDPATILLAQTVENSLARSTAFSRFARLDAAPLAEQEVDDLGLHGLNPAYYRRCPQRARHAFISKLLPDEPGNGRTLTARLLIATLQQRGRLTTDDIRAVWHTGRFSGGKPLKLKDEELVVHRERWAVFQSRQYQRYIIELFMGCFENAIAQGSRSMAEISASSLRQFRPSPRFPRTFRDCLMQEGRAVSASKNWETIAVRYDRQVHPSHPAYIGMLLKGGFKPCELAVRMLARWWLQMCVWLNWDRHQELFALGGEERISMKWFWEWVRARLDEPLVRFVRDIFEQLVFAQHIRVALSRFDGTNQRLRFVLGDDGIVPTIWATEKLAGNEIPGWTADRLDAFVSLLCDLCVLVRDESHGLMVGEMARAVQ